MWVYITEELQQVIKKCLERDQSSRLGLEEALAGISKAKILKSKTEIQNAGLKKV